MENPFEIIIERLDRIEKALEKLNHSSNNDDEVFLSQLETAK
jgi:hypothetical protein